DKTDASLANIFLQFDVTGFACSTDACEGSLNTFRRPSFDRRRRHARRDDVRSFARTQGHLLARRAYRYGAALNKHAEAVIARSREESRAAYRDQRERTANLYPRATRRSVEQHRSRAQRHLPTGVDKKAIDLQARLFTKPDRRIAAKPHCQPGRHAGYDFLPEKDRGGSIERAANCVKLGECFTRDVLDRADSL